MIFSINKDTKAFAEALARERQNREDLPSELSAAVCVLCDERLAEFRKAASMVFLSWRTQYELGRKMIAQAPHSGTEIPRMLEKAASADSQGARNCAIASLFPKKNTEVALCNLLAFLDSVYRGLCTTIPREFAGSSRDRTYARLGGKENVQFYLRPSRIVVSAAACLYLCESGANPSVGMTRRLNALRPSRFPKYRPFSDRSGCVFASLREA